LAKYQNMDLILARVILQFGVEKFDSLAKIKYRLSRKYQGLYLELLAWRIYTIPVLSYKKKNYKSQKRNKSEKRKNPWKSKNKWIWKKKKTYPYHKRQWRKKEKRWKIKIQNQPQNQPQPQPQTQFHHQPENQPVLQPQSQLQNQQVLQIQSQPQNQQTLQPQSQPQIQPQNQISSQLLIENNCLPQQISRWEKRKPLIMSENLLCTTCEWDEGCSKSKSTEMKTRIKEECSQLKLKIGAFCNYEDGLEIGMVNFKEDWEKWSQVMKWDKSIDTLSSLIDYLSNKPAKKSEKKKRKIGSREINSTLSEGQKYLNRMNKN
jgi:hypothetical protein